MLKEKNKKDKINRPDRINKKRATHLNKTPVKCTNERRREFLRLRTHIDTHTHIQIHLTHRHFLQHPLLRQPTTIDLMVKARNKNGLAIIVVGSCWVWLSFGLLLYRDTRPAPDSLSFTRPFLIILVRLLLPLLHLRHECHLLFDSVLLIRCHLVDLQVSLASHSRCVGSDSHLY